LEILGANVKMPIYNPKGDLIWPQNIDAEEIFEMASESNKGERPENEEQVVDEQVE